MNTNENILFFIIGILCIIIDIKYQFLPATYGIIGLCGVITISRVIDNIWNKR